MRRFGRLSHRYVQGEEMQSKIYITYHKSSHLVNGVILSPIQVGTGPDLPGCVLRDDSGVNIAHLNDRYCEMTAAYWVWKNDCSHDFIGLLHYRRFFDFHETCLLMSGVW